MQHLGTFCDSFLIDQIFSLTKAMEKSIVNGSGIDVDSLRVPRPRRRHLSFFLTGAFFD